MVGSYDFQLEEFVPNRMKATLSTPKIAWVQDDSQDQQNEVILHAEHLFGASAENRKAEVEAVVSAYYSSSRWKGFRFNGGLTQNLSRPISLGQAQTDKEGNALFKFSKKLTAAQPLQIALRGKVYELGGRVVRAKTAVTSTTSTSPRSARKSPRSRPARRSS